MHKYLILILLLYSCDNVTSPQIKEDTGGSTQYEYLINFKGLNPGHNFDVCTLVWNQNQNQNFQFYQLRNAEEIIATINQSQDTIFIRNLTPSVFEKIYIDVMAGSNITDSIEIYTRPIKPITDLSVVANADNWFSTLNWIPSDEISTVFDKYSIYRSDLNTDNFVLIHEINNQTDYSYIDTITTWGYEYYYKIITHITEGYSRPSIIQSNIINNNISHEINLSTTTNEYHRIQVNWTHDLNEEEFYAIEIWRTNNQTEDPLNDYLLATITDYNKTLLEDSYLIGNGISWFYKLKLIDQFGNISYSEIKAGNTLP